MSFKSLPAEDIYLIFKHLLNSTSPEHAVLNSRRVCRLWKVIIDNVSILKLAIPNYILRDSFMAAESLEQVQWLKSRFDISMSCDESLELLYDHPLLQAAIKKADTTVLEWFIDNFICEAECKYRLLALSIPRMNTEKLEWLATKLAISDAHIKEFKLLNIKNIFALAASTEKLEVLQWTYTTFPLSILQTTETGNVAIFDAFNAATACGCLSMLRWLKHTFRIEHMPLLKNMFETAAAKGHMHVIKWLDDTFHLRPADVSSRALWNATTEGHLNVLTWIKQQFPYIMHPEAIYMFNAAVESGQLDVLLWIKENIPLPFISQSLSRSNQDYFKNFFLVAVASGHLQVLKWLSDNFNSMYSPFYDDSAFYTAVENGRLDVIKWMLEAFYTRRGGTYDYTYFCWKNFIQALDVGQMRVVRWMVESEFIPAVSLECASSMIVKFALQNDIDGLTWLRATFRLIRVEAVLAFLKAIEEGCSISTLQWLRKNFNIRSTDLRVRSCNEALRAAAKCRSKPILEWVIKEFELGVHEIRQCQNHLFRKLAKYDCFDAMRWLQHAFSLTKEDAAADCNYALRWSVANGNMEAMKWLIRKFSLTAGDATQDMYCHKRRIPTNQILYDTGRFMIVSKAMCIRVKSAFVIATEGCRFEMLNYLTRTLGIQLSHIERSKKYIFRKIIKIDNFEAFQWLLSTFTFAAEDLVYFSSKLKQRAGPTTTSSRCQKIMQGLQDVATQKSKRRRLM